SVTSQQPLEPPGFIHGEQSGKDWLPRGASQKILDRKNFHGLLGKHLDEPSEAFAESIGMMRKSKIQLDKQGRL
ncbi:MAG: hypothetical protein WAX03_07985, partial [Trichococcus flocculiformis]